MISPRPLAAEWALHAKKVADHYGLECEVIRLEGAPSPGESVESWARQARYRAFEALLTAGSFSSSVPRARAGLE
jgi:hypothetical protein